MCICGWLVASKDCINRLSAPARLLDQLAPNMEAAPGGTAVDSRSQDVAQQLTEAAKALLRKGVALNVDAWQAALQDDAQSAEELRAFLGSQNVMYEPVWRLATARPC